MSNYQLTIIMVFGINLICFNVIKHYMAKLIINALSTFNNHTKPSSYSQVFQKAYTYTISLSLALAITGEIVNKLISSGTIMVMPFNIGIISYLSLANAYDLIRTNFCLYLLLFICADLLKNFAIKAVSKH